MEINEFENYTANKLRPQNTQSREPEIKTIGEKFQDKNEFIIHNDIINGMIQKFDPHLWGKLDNVTWMNFNPNPFLGRQLYQFTSTKGYHMIWVINR